MEIAHTNIDIVTSRREQARIHEELSYQEKALRETRIRSVHEVEEMKRAQEIPELFKM